MRSSSPSCTAESWCSCDPMLGRRPRRPSGTASAFELFCEDDRDGGSAGAAAGGGSGSGGETDAGEGICGLIDGDGDGDKATGGVQEARGPPG